MVSVRDDSAARAAAIDPARSFIVEAPAGSGKTELLIQRYLGLLATVEEPEQVVAITFTRKAAAEMRRRVLKALRAASAGEQGGAPHEIATLSLARAVAARDAALAWALAAEPQRLRIDTLDALNVRLAQQLPLLADGAGAARIVENAAHLYSRAARRMLGALGREHAVGASLRTLAREFDNDLAALEQLLAALLPKREQWLHALAGPDAGTLRAVLERALRHLVDERLEALAAAMSPSELAELERLLRHAANAAPEPLRQELAPWLAADAPTGDTALAAWRGAAKVLLTSAWSWRRKITKLHGFGSEHSAERDRFVALLAKLEPNEALRAALEAAAKLPEPRYTDAQWQHLAALRTVLVQLTAELKVTFAEEQAVDFVELALAAQRALGQVDAPSELLLALDRRIQHLLVDEFQDTSKSQLRLLELLTAGWQPDDGRTLFVVGDPMQSIYRFRDADMSLFLKAKQRGIGTIDLEHVALTRNFRSAPAIVDWVNTTFAAVFPAEDRIAAGAASFRASAAVREGSPEQLVQMHALRVADAEPVRVIEILDAERRRAPEQSIAVLVQSRTHLAGLHERLRAQGWPVHAVEIETPAEQPVAHDLLALARALVHLGDRIAWLAVLRAPWCGIGWRDLDALCGDLRDATIWELLHDAERLERLSADGRVRARALRARLTAAFARRAALPFADWIEQTWRDLDGPACLDAPADAAVAEQVLALLAAASRRGDLDDPARLHELLTAAQPQADPPRERGIEIMTMHRAKGLEFDTVVLLGLGREPKAEESKALYWLDRVAASGADELIVGPLTSDTDGAKLVAFVRSADRERTAAERARLLYVAATRARERLHLVAYLAPSKETPSESTLLALLWPRVAAQFALEGPSTPPAAPGDDVLPTPPLRRLAAPAGDATLTVQLELAPPAAARPEFEWAGQAAVHVGTVVHRYLQQVADHGVEAFDSERFERSAAAIERELTLLGVERHELGAARTRVVAALRAAVEDPQGRWVLGEHEDARSELGLTVRAGDRLEHLRLDRTFVAEGVRWIVDFKTGQHEGAEVEAFLESEVQRYKPQLERYAAAFAAVESRPIRLALYFPLLRRLESWPIP